MSDTVAFSAEVVDGRLPLSTPEEFYKHLYVDMLWSHTQRVYM